MQQAVRTKIAKLNTKGKVHLHIPTLLHMYSSVNCLWVSDDRIWPVKHSFWERLSFLHKLQLYFPDDYIFYQKQQLRNGQIQYQKRSPALTLWQPVSLTNDMGKAGRARQLLGLDSEE